MPVKRKYKTFVQRWAAGIVDGVVFLPFTFIVYHYADYDNKTDFYAWNFAYILLWLAYSTWLHGKYGQTLGKMASTIKVYALDERSMIGYTNAFLRELIWLVLSIAGLLYYGSAFLFYLNWIVLAIELLTMSLNSKRRALHDYLAGSVVLDITRYKKWDIEYEEYIREQNENPSQ